MIYTRTIEPTPYTATKHGCPDTGWIVFIFDKSGSPEGHTLHY